MASREWLAIAALVTPAAGVVLSALTPQRALHRIAVVTAIAAASFSTTLATIALTDPGDPFLGRWIVVDAAGGLLIGVIGIVGLASTLVSSQVLGHAAARCSRRTTPSVSTG